MMLNQPTYHSIVLGIQFRAKQEKKQDFAKAK